MYHVYHAWNAYIRLSDLLVSLLLCSNRSVFHVYYFPYFSCHNVNLRTFEDEWHKPPACSVGESVAVGHSLLIGQCGCRLLHVWQLESLSRQERELRGECRYVMTFWAVWILTINLNNKHCSFSCEWDTNRYHVAPGSLHIRGPGRPRNSLAYGLGQLFGVLGWAGSMKNWPKDNSVMTYGFCFILLRTRILVYRVAKKLAHLLYAF